MSLTLLLFLTIVGLSLVLLFRSQESRLAQFLAVGEIALSGFSLFLERVHGFTWPWSKGDTAILLQGAMVLVALLIFVCLTEKRWATVLIFATFLLVLVRLKVVTEL